MKGEGNIAAVLTLICSGTWHQLTRRSHNAIVKFAIRLEAFLHGAYRGSHRY